MLGLGTAQLTCFVLGMVATLLATWQAKTTKLQPQKAVMAYLWFVMIADVIGVTIQAYATKGVVCWSGHWYIRAAQVCDVALYLGWSAAFATLSVWVFGKEHERVWFGVGILVVWITLCKVTWQLCPGYYEATPEALASHKTLVDHILTIAHVCGVAVGCGFAARFYLTKNWPLLPHLSTTILLAGAISDCAGEYAHAKPSSDYDLSSVAGSMVYSFVLVAHVYAILRKGGGA